MSAKFVRVVDFETTGIDPASSDVIEAGWCDAFEDCRIEGPYSLLVKTDRPIELKVLLQILGGQRPVVMSQSAVEVVE
jgi:DNA polymerase III epsilon subunit-like protein